MSVPWADCHFSVSLCTHHPHPLGEGAPSPIFFKGRRGGVCTQAISVYALGRLSFQFRIPTKPLLSLNEFIQSLTLLYLDKWQLAKCDVTHSFTLRPTHFPPHPYWDHTLSWRSREKNSFFHNWSLRRFQWHNYIWNWHLLHYNSIRLKPKQDHLGNTDVIP